MKTKKLGLQTIKLVPRVKDGEKVYSLPKDPTAWQLAKAEGKNPITMTFDIMGSIVLLILGLGLAYQFTGLTTNLRDGMRGIVGIGIAIYAIYWTLKRIERDHG